MSYACKDCGYFGSNDNTCRFNAPTPLDTTTPSNKQDAIWPIVDPVNDWCGEFKQAPPSAG